VIPFAFKYVMWVPVPHLIFIWYGVCQFGLQLRFYAELYQHLASAYAEEDDKKKGTTTKRIRNSDIGIWRYQWRIINFLVLGLEVGFIAKTLYLEYSNLTPPVEILAIWLFIVIALAFCLTFSFGKSSIGSRSKQSTSRSSSSSAAKRKVP
jgi:hypothetical protein